MDKRKFIKAFLISIGFSKVTSSKSEELEIKQEIKDEMAPQATVTPTPSTTSTASPSSSRTPTTSPSNSLSNTPSISTTSSVTPSTTRTPTRTPSGTPTRTPSGTPTNTPSTSFSSTPSISVTSSISASPSNSLSATVTPSVTPTVTPSVSSLLPIKLLFFEAVWNGSDSVNISFATAMEQNNKGFEILRSDNQNPFKPIKWIDGKNNSNQIVNYHFSDNQVIKSSQYSYLLIQHDLDGIKNKIANSSIDTFSNDIIVGEVSPNPLSGHGSINIQSSINSYCQLKITNLIGSVIYNYNGNIMPGQNMIELNLTNIKSGLYFLKIEINQLQFTRNIIIN